MQILRNSIFYIFLFVTASLAQASTVVEVTVKCPIDGKSFKTLEAASGTQFGQNLDLKPFGPILAPWPIAKCPNNGFVIFKPDFTKDEIKSLKEFVLSEEYQSLQKIESNYYLAATLLKKQNAPKLSIAFTLLKSTWEVEPGDKYIKYATETLFFMKSIIADPPADSDQKDIMHYQHLAGEMERRLGRFDAAKTRFEKLLSQKEIKGTTLENVVLQEITHVLAKDSNTHEFTQTK